MLPNVSGEFRVVADPELRFTPAGKAVASARIVANSNKKNKETGEWEQDKECWLNVSIWEKQAENFAESVVKGDLIFVTGRLETRSYETREGEKRQSYDVTADTAAVVLRYATAKVTKVERSGGTAAAGSTSAPAAGSEAASAPPVDPWATPAADSEPPF